jgi:ABC-type glycerol-3-phosphate transport system substrate-binding protein
MGRSDNVARAIDILYMLMLQYNVDFYNANYSQAQFTKQKAVNTSGIGLNPSAEALKLYTSFALPTNKNYSWNAYLSDSKSAVKEMDTFARGKVSMVFGYSYLYDQIAAQVKDLKDKGVNTIDTKDIGVSVVPQVNDPKTSTEKRVAFANYYAETVSRTSKNPDAAWDFLLFASSKENLQYYNEKTHRPTSRRDMIEDQMKDPIYGVFAEQIGFAESLQVYDAARYQLIFSQAIDSVLATVAPTEAMRTAEDQINTLLPKDGLVPPAPKEESAEAKLQDAKKEAATSKTTKTTQQ